MSESPDPKDGDKKAEEGAPKQSGRVAHDAKGNPVWEWETATGVFGRDVSTARLKKLESTELSLQETVSVPKLESEKSAKPKEPLPGGGRNPYDSSEPVRNTAPRRPQARAQQRTRSAPAQSFWQRLKRRLLGK